MTGRTRVRVDVNRARLPDHRANSLLEIAGLGPGLPPDGVVIKSATSNFPDRGDGVETIR